MRIPSSRLLVPLALVALVFAALSSQARTVFVGFGEPFTLVAADFTAPPAFSNQSRAVAEYVDPVTGEERTAFLRVEGSTGLEITLRWHRRIKLYDRPSLQGKLVSAELAGDADPAFGDMAIRRLTVDGSVCEATLYLCHPYVRNLQQQGDGSYTVDAVLFGEKKPRVQIEFTSTRGGGDHVPDYRNCRVHDLVFVDGVGANPAQTFSFTVPNLRPGETPTGHFIFTNRIGISARQPDLAEAELATAFDNAVLDTSVREYSEISKDLKALTPDNPDPELIWDASGRVKVIVWSGNYWSGVQPGDIITDFSPADDLSLGYFMYVAPYGEVVDYMRKHKFSLDQEMNNRLKLAQKLGLQVADGNTTRKTRFLIMWAPPESLFRPAPDPEVDDAEAQLARSYGQVDIANAWITKHYDWKIANSYTPGSAYPFTGFGYTYDWSGAGSEIGVSEFVILPEHEIEVIDNVLTADFFASLDD